MRNTLRFLIVVMMFVLFSQFVSSIPQIVVNETDLISLKLRAYDEDGDPLTYYFSPPLDNAGRWKTDYGDAGEYLVDITVSDGKTSTIEHVKIFVLAKNRPPEIKNINDIIAKEGDLISIRPKATDYEGDSVTIRISPPIGNDGEWQTDPNSAGVYNISVIANDGYNEVIEQFTLTIKNSNRPPEIIEYEPLEDEEISETDRLQFNLVASDPDHENLTYAWFIDGEQVSDKQRFIYQPAYNSTGTHQVKGTASDGIHTASIYWNIVVKNLNRAPILEEIPAITVNEEDLVKITPVAYDPDGDIVSYNFSAPFNNIGEWQTTYDDGGIHDVIVTAYDGKDKTTQDVKVIVKNVDRAPFFTGEIEEIEINEGDELDLTIGINDPDGDVIALTAAGLPNGATLTGNKLVYKPDYTVIRKSDNWVNTLLQKLHLDGLYPDKKTFRITLNAASKELSARKRVKLTVLDSNRAPVLQPIKDIIINENDRLILKPKATDYDFDKLTYKISLPVGNDGEWQTDYEDNGAYNVTIKVSDGELEDSQTVKVNVKNVNRQPVFKELPDVINANEYEDVVISLKNRISDADGDPIEVVAENLPPDAVFEDEMLTWKPDYDTVKTKTNSLTNKMWSKIPLFNRAFSPDKKDFRVKFIASDKESAVEEDVIIRVKNVNRLSRIENSYPPFYSIRARTNEAVVFGVVADDPDNDQLKYTWKLGGLNVIRGTPVIRRTFTESGDKEVELVISDGLNSITRTWTVKVQ